MLWVKDPYIRVYHTKVKEKRANYIILEEQVFYPGGGGQPADKGWIEHKRGKSVIEKIEGEKIYLKKPLPEEGELVKCVIDWDWRFRMMQMHSALHLLSAIIKREFGAELCGNQIGYEKSRADFRPFKPKEDDIKNIEELFEKAVFSGIPIRSYFVTKEFAEKIGIKVPKNVRKVRIVEIVGVDKQACLGSHVNNTKEIGKLKILKKINKGKDTTRLIFTLEEL